MAFDAVLDAGWAIDRMRLAHDVTCGTRALLQVNTERDWWHTVFEIKLTFDIAMPLHVREMSSVVNIIEQWHPIPTAPAVDLNAVDREALAKMFPDLETPRSMRGRATRGVIKS